VIEIAFSVRQTDKGTHGGVDPTLGTEHLACVYYQIGEWVVAGMVRKKCWGLDRLGNWDLSRNYTSSNHGRRHVTRAGNEPWRHRHKPAGRSWSDSGRVMKYLGVHVVV
jgi:hypothetical protein